MSVRLCVPFGPTSRLAESVPVGHVCRGEYDGLLYFRGRAGVMCLQENGGTLGEYVPLDRCGARYHDLGRLELCGESVD